MGLGSAGTVLTSLEKKTSEIKGDWNQKCWTKMISIEYSRKYLDQRQLENEYNRGEH